MANGENKYNIWTELSPVMGTNLEVIVDRGVPIKVFLLMVL